MTSPLIYLNAGTHSLTPPQVSAAQREALERFELNPTASLFAAWGELWRVQQALAAHFHADGAEIFLRPNVTAALNDFILGIPLPAGSEILQPDLEYPAISNICRFRAERDGLTFRTFHLGAMPPSPEAALAAIVAALRPETSLLLISHIVTANGLKVPMRELARETRKRGVILVMDGAHTAGAEPLDFRELDDVDFFGTNLHKWFLGPKGASFGWVPRRHHERLQPIQAGWMTYERPEAFAEFGGGSRFAEKMLASGCQNFSSYFAIPATLALWRTLGEAQVFARLRELQAHLLQAMRQEGPAWACVSPADPALRGPLLSYELPHRLAQEGLAFMHRLRQDHGLQTSVTRLQGRPVLRLSPHLYNTEAELVRTAQILKAVDLK
jgi:isopenicillin-N epimerase